MRDAATIVMLTAGALAIFVFVVVHIKVRKARRQHSLGDMYRPVPKENEPPTTPRG